MSIARLAPLLVPTLALLACGDSGSRDADGDASGASPTPGSISVTNEVPTTGTNPTDGATGNLTSGTGGMSDSATGDRPTR